MAVDTGATFTLIQPDILRSVGVEPRPDGPTLDIVTTSTTERSRMAPVVWLAALGVRRDRMLVVSHTLPLAVRLDGLLGLDFRRDHRLTIDFRESTIDLD